MNETEKRAWEVGFRSRMQAAAENKNWERLASALRREQGFMDSVYTTAAHGGQEMAIEFQARVEYLMTLIPISEAWRVHQAQEVKA